MSPRRSQRHSLALVVAVSALTLGGLTGIPLWNQLASANPLPANGAIDPVARAAAEFAPSRQGDRLQGGAVSAAEERRAELQVGTPSVAPDAVAQARQNDLRAVVQQLATDAQTAELKRVFDARSAQETQRRANPEKVATMPTVTAEKVFANDPKAAPGKVVSPVTQGTYSLSAWFGATGLWYPYHTGQDFAAPEGTPTYAVTDAVVGVSVTDWWAGNNVVLYHPDGTASLYAHLNDVTVAPGTIVHAGDLVGHIGNTGRSFGGHLHFEIYPAGMVPGDNYKAIDPAAWLRSKGATI